MEEKMSSMALSSPADVKGMADTVIKKRVELFEKLQKEQAEAFRAKGGDPIKITMPDGAVRDGKKWITSPMDVAREISQGLANSALIAEVNGVLWDMTRPLEGDCTLQLHKFESDKGRDTFWHSSAHILGQSIEMTYGCKLCIGPCTTRGEGFYYDAFYHGLTLTEKDDFGKIQAQANKAVKDKQPFERIEVTREQALEFFAENPFKVEIINELPEDKTITVYRCGPLVDLCRGPHIPSTSHVKAFACLRASASYWRGRADRESLQRVYGISYPDNKLLKEYLHNVEEAKKRDHRKLGQQQELFFFHELSPGSCFFLPHGARIYNKLQAFIRDEYRKRGYEEVVSPNMFNMQLWETSGHAANYKDNMFTFEVEKQEFGLKPMNCPGHCLIFDHRVRSYRELPLRTALLLLRRTDRSAEMTGRTLKGNLAFLSAGILSILSLVAAVGGVSMIVIVFVMDHSPSRVGWLFIIVGGFTVASGLLGVFSSDRRDCFTWQMVFLLFSTLGLLAAALTIFFKPNEVLGLLHYKNVSEDRARWILRLEAAFFAITFRINTVIAILGICVNCCDVVDHYEDLEKTNRSKSALGRTQTEAIKRAAKNEETKASKLAQKMKDKYGKWTQEYGTPAKV